MVLGNVSPRKRKRLQENDREYNRQILPILKDGTVEEKVLFLLRESGELGLTADELAIRLGLFGKHLKKALNDPISTKKMVVVDSASQRYVSVEIAEKMKEMLITHLTDYHKNNPLQPGIAKEELRTGLGRKVDPKVFQYCLNELIRKARGRAGRVAGPPGRASGGARRPMKNSCAGISSHWYRSRGLSTPTIKETMEQFAEYPPQLVKEVLDLQLRDGKLFKISESLYYTKELIEPLIASVLQYMEKTRRDRCPGL